MVLAIFGGTILGTTNHAILCVLFVTDPDGSQREVDRSDDIIDHLRGMDIDALVCVGGDGTLTIANVLHQKV